MRERVRERVRAPVCVLRARLRLEDEGVRAVAAGDECVVGAGGGVVDVLEGGLEVAFSVVGGEEGPLEENRETRVLITLSRYSSAIF